MISSKYEKVEIGPALKGKTEINFINDMTFTDTPYYFDRKNLVAFRDKLDSVVSIYEPVITGQVNKFVTHDGNGMEVCVYDKTIVLNRQTSFKDPLGLELYIELLKRCHQHLKENTNEET